MRPLKIKVEGLLKAVKKGRGGVSIAHHKNTAGMRVIRIPTPPFVQIAMTQGIGAPCTPVVNVGDYVKLGQLIGDSDAYISAPIYASISGTVTEIKDIKLSTGVTSKAVVIESDGLMAPDEFTPPVVTDAQSLVAAVRKSGLVGHGGAGFPAHDKINLPQEAKIDTLIINAAECEPYITVDYRECVENSVNIMRGVNAVSKYLHIDNVIIAVEDNKPIALQILKEIADSAVEGEKVKVMALKSRYPQGAEKMIIQSATGRKMPPGKLPSDVGCVVMNVASIAFIGRYVATGKPLVSRSMTIDGSAIKTPKNVRVPIGTMMDYIIDYCGGFTEEPEKIVCGGPMMGAAITNINYPILKGNNALLAFKKGDLSIKKETDCIRCGRCAAACPLNLVPTNIEKFTKIGDIPKLKHSGAMVCMECGSCAYSCPAGKPLVQHMRLAKATIREKEAKK